MSTRAKKRRRAAKQATGGSAARAASARRRGRTSSADGRTDARASRPPALQILAGSLVAATVPVAALAYDGRLFAPYYVPRLAVFYVLVAALALVAALSLVRRRAPVRLDALDAVALAFAAWQVVAALASPAGALAWAGYYNRGSGAVFWAALAVLLVLARRVLDADVPQKVVAGAFTGTLLVAGSVALLQAFDVDAWWGAGGVVGARVTGTLGNPVHLGALGLIGVWLAVAASRRGGVVWRAVCATGAVAGLVCLVLAVSRAAYLGALAAALLVLVVWLRQRRWRSAIALAAVLGALAVGALVYAPGDEGDGLVSRLGSFRQDGRLNVSDDRRVELWGEALEAVGERPLVGYGPGAFVVADRIHRDIARKALHPWTLASDPHSLPLALAAGGGIPGVLLGGLIMLGVLWAGRRRMRSPSAEGGVDDGRSTAPALLDGLPACSYLMAASVFALVSPVDLVLAAPLALAGAVVAGRAVPGRLGWELAWPTSGGGKVVAYGLSAAAAAVLVATLLFGGRAWSADASFDDTARTRTWEGAGRAAELAPWEAFYALEAGARRWRSGLDEGDEAAVRDGERLVLEGIDADPTAAHGYADLARLAIARGELETAVDELRRGLRWNPDHPVLQGLWGYAALSAEEQLGNPTLAGRLLDALVGLPVSTPDGWYWVSKTFEARGETARATAARARADELAPKLGANRYGQRLLHAR